MLKTHVNDKLMKTNLLNVIFQLKNQFEKKK